MKNSTISFMLLALSTTCWSQEGVIWEKRLDTYDVNRTTDAQITSDGGYIIGGHTNEALDQYASADTDVWVVKLDGEGEVDWERLVASRNKAVLKRVFQTPEEARIIRAPITTSDDSSVQQDEFAIAQAPVPENRIQSRMVRSTRSSYNNIEEDLSDPSFLEKEITEVTIEEEKDDLWKLRLDPEFEMQWQKDLGDGSERKLRSVVSSPSGSILASGYSTTSDPNDPYPNTDNNKDFYVASYTAEGVLEWSKFIGGDKDDQIVKTIATQDGGFLLGGISESGIGQSKTTKHLGGKDWWVVKIDAQGEILWQRTFGNFTDDKLTSLQELDNGDILLGGTKAIIAKEKYATAQNRGVTEDFSIIKINKVGIVKWQLELGGSGREYLTSALQKENNEIIISGLSYSTPELVSEEEEKVSDIWVINYGIKDLESFEKILKTKESKKKTIFKSTKAKRFNRLEYYDETGNLLDTKYTYKIKRLALKKEEIVEGTKYVRIVSGNSAAVLDWEEEGTLKKD